MNLGRLLITSGLVLVVLGALSLALGKLNLPFGRLPGDFVFRSRNTTIYFPWVTCVVLSLLGSLLLWFVNRHH